MALSSVDLSRREQLQQAFEVFSQLVQGLWTNRQMTPEDIAGRDSVEGMPRTLRNIPQDHVLTFYE